MATVERILSRAMTVGEMRSALEDLPEDAAVVFVCDYGDICHTQQALTFRKCGMADGVLKPSAYSHSGMAYVASDEMDDADPDAEPLNVVVLR